MNKHYSLQKWAGHPFVRFVAAIACLYFFAPSSFGNTFPFNASFNILETKPKSDLLLNDSSTLSTEIARRITQEKKNHLFLKKNLFEKSPINLQEKYNTYVTAANWLQVQKSELKTLFEAELPYINLSLPMENGAVISLDLMKMEVLSPDFKVTTSKGEHLDLGKKTGLFYWGMIENQPQSLAAFAIYEDQLTAIIADKTGTYELGPLEEEENLYVFYHSQDLLFRNQSSCGNEDRMLIQPLPETTLRQSGSEVCGRAIEVFLEADYLSFQALNQDVEAVAAFITSFFSVTALLYFNEKIPLQLSEIMVWTEEDAYDDNEPLSALFDFSDAKQDNFNGDLAHLISVRQGANSISGVGWINALCASYDPADHSGRTAYTEVFDNFNIFPSQSGTVSLFAHELGHNCGSRHTHACVWGPNQNTALDNCMTTEGSCNSGNFPPESGGSIMSYCYDIDYLAGFWEEPGDLIRTVYRSAGCFIFGHEELVLNETLIESGVYLATQQIVSGSKIESSSFVRFISANAIQLEAGFEVAAGADFEALIDEGDYCFEIETCAVPALVCGEATMGNHANGQSNWENYCGTAAPDGPMVIYQFYTDGGGDITAITSSDNNSKAAIFGSCDNPNSCIAYTPNVTVGNVNYVTAQNLTAGTYYVVVSGDEGGDFEIELVCSVNANGEEIEERHFSTNTGNSIKVFPNPVSEVATVQFELQEAASTTLELFDFMGRRVKVLLSAAFFEKGQHEIRISMEALENGVYFLRMNVEGKEVEVFRLSKNG